MERYDARVRCPSGEKLYYLSRGAYAAVSFHNGQVLIHLRKYFCPRTKNGNAEDFEGLTTVLPSTKGVCLDMAGWQRLMSVKDKIEADYACMSVATDRGFEEEKEDKKEYRGAVSN